MDGIFIFLMVAAAFYSGFQFGRAYQGLKDGLTDEKSKND
jgi:hypothetical protein